MTQDKNKKALWAVLSVLIAAATLWTVTSQNRCFSFSAFWSYLQGTAKGWLLTAVACSCGFVFFEAAALRSACRPFGHSKTFGKGITYSAADIYFSAITPSATGGQPVCAYFMIKDGIPGTLAAAVLLANLTMYTLAILVVGILVFLFYGNVFLSFGMVAKILILVGYLVQLALAGFFLLLLKNERTLHSICSAALRFLCRIRLLRREEEKQKKLDKLMKEYGESVGILKGRKKMLVKIFFLNLLQRISIISVTVFVFLSAGGNVSQAARLWAIQSYVVIGSNSTPIPGAMGVSDYLMLKGFEMVMSPEHAANLQMLSRSLSFYFCIIFCGIWILGSYLIRKGREKL